MVVKLVVLAVASTVCPDTESDVAEALVAFSCEIVVVARVEVPVTESVPLDTKDEVAVIDPPIKALKVAEIALIRFAKNEVVVAFVMVAFVPKIPVEVIDVAEAFPNVV